MQPAELLYKTVQYSPALRDMHLGKDKAIVPAGVRPRNKNQCAVLRGFEFLLNIVTGPGFRVIRSLHNVDFPERRFQVVPCA
jgi:hypothetical protein